MGVSAILDLVSMRDNLGILWDFQNEQEIWSIGQVGALFTWAPLLGDMLCIAMVDAFQRWRRGWLLR